MTACEAGFLRLCECQNNVNYGGECEFEQVIRMGGAFCG